MSELFNCESSAAASPRCEGCLTLKRAEGEANLATTLLGLATDKLEAYIGFQTDAEATSTGLSDHLALSEAAATLGDQSAQAELDLNERHSADDKITEWAKKAGANVEAASDQLGQAMDRASAASSQVEAIIEGCDGNGPREIGLPFDRSLDICRTAASVGLRRVTYL